MPLVQRGERRMTDESAALSRSPRTHAEKGINFNVCEEPHLIQSKPPFSRRDNAKNVSISL